MYEKKNKLSQPAPILDEISARLSDAVHRNLMKNAPFFFKTLIFNRCFGKYRLNVQIFWTKSEASFTFLNMLCQLHHSDTVFYCLKYYPFMNDFYLTILAQKSVG